MVGKRIHRPRPRSTIDRRSTDDRPTIDPTINPEGRATVWNVRLFPVKKTAMASEAKPDAVPERFEEILARLRALVDRLEGGNLPLEESLRAFEDGMELCRRGTAILDGAEKKVEMLLGGAGAPRVTSFDQT
jgi:exodeoxyribonuclease VII small subunit